MSNSSGDKPPVPIPLKDFSKRPAYLSGWAEPVHDALDELVDRAEQGGTETSRTQIAAALVLDAYRHKSAVELGRLLNLLEEARIVYTGSGDLPDDIPE